MTRPYGLLRAGFPFVKTLGMRRVTNSPMDVAVGADGSIFVLGRSGTINRLPWDDLGTDWGSYTTGPVIQRSALGPNTLGGPGTDEGKFTWPVSMVIDREQNLWVSDEAIHRITAITTQDEVVASWGEHGEDEGLLNRPAGIALDSDGNILVADALNHRVQRFTPEGALLSAWGARGSGDGELDMPWGIAVDEMDDVYVSDWRNDRVQKFSADGEFIMGFGRSGSGKSEFNGPAGLAVDKDGDIYVADPDNNRLQLFDQNGRYVETFIGDATLSNMAREYMLTNAYPNRLREMADLEPQKRLRSPRAVTVDDDGRMFIPDFASFRVQVYQKEAIPLAEGQISPPVRSPALQTT